MNALLHDVRYAVRLLSKKPGLTAIIVISLALGIGANTLMFSVVNSVLLRSLPYPDPDRLVAVWFTPPHQPDQKSGTNAFGYFELRENNHVFESIGAGRLTAAFNIAGDSPSAEGRDRVQAQWFTPGMVRTLGVNPMIGRWPGEQELGRIVISYGLWQRLFGGSRDIVGKKLLIDGGVTTVMGVTPPGFELLNPAQFWLFQFDPELRNAIRSPNRIFTLVARLKPGVSLEQAQAEMNILAGDLAQKAPEMNQGWGIKVETLRDAYVGQVKRALLVFQGAVVFVLLIACANAAGLLLAQASARQKELAMRAALGSGRWRIVRQLLTQSTVLAAAAGGLGTALAAFGLPVFVHLAPPDLPGGGEITLNSTVLVFTVLVSLAAGLLFGVLPALQLSRPDLQEVLRESARTATAGAARQRLRGAFVVAQISLAVVLLTGAGLMINSFVRLAAVQQGFDPRRLITFQVPFPRSFYTADGSVTPAGGLAVELKPRLHLLSEQMRARLAALPGVESAAFGVTPPLGGEPRRLNFAIPGRVTASNEQEVLTAEWYPVSPDYFRTLQVPLLRGREFDSHDLDAGKPVAVVNATMALQFWPDQDPIGRQLQMDVLYDAPREIVGVVGDVRQNRYQHASQPQMYVPRNQLPLKGDMSAAQFMMLTTFVIRAHGDPAGLAPAMRAAVAAVDPSEAVTQIRTVEEYASAQLQDTRKYVTLLGVFGSISVALAVIGIFGIMAHSVSQRRNEIGIRMALGAGSGEVLRLMLRRGLHLIAAGVFLGLAASLALMRVIQGFLWNVTTTDPLTFTLVAMVLAGAGVAACYLPARRALKVDPLAALHYE